MVYKTYYFIKKNALFVKGLYRGNIISMRTCEFVCVCVCENLNFKHTSL